MQRSTELDLKNQIQREERLVKQMELRLELAKLYKEQENNLAALNECLQIIKFRVKEINVTEMLNTLRFKLNLELDRYETVRQSLRNRQQIATASYEPSTRFKLCYLKGLRVSLQNLDEAVHYFEQAKKILDTNQLELDNFEKSFFFSKFGTLLARYDHLEHEAEFYFTQAINTEATHARTYTARGVVNYRLNFPQAERDFNEGVCLAEQARIRQAENTAMMERDFVHPEVREYAKKIERLLLEQEAYARLTRAAFYLDDKQNEKAMQDWLYIVNLEGMTKEYQLICLINLYKLNYQGEFDVSSQIERFMNALKPQTDFQRAVLGLAQLIQPKQDTDSLNGLINLIEAIFYKWLPFHLTRDIVVYLSERELPKESNLFDTIKSKLTNPDASLSIMKEELLKFIRMTPQTRLKLLLILGALKENTALNILFSIPRGARSTALNRGSFKELVQMLKELYDNEPELVREIITSFPFSLSRKQEIENAYPWIKRVFSIQVSHREVSASRAASSSNGARASQSPQVLMPAPNPGIQVLARLSSMIRTS